MIKHLNGQRYDDTDPDSVDSVTPPNSCPIADKAVKELATLSRRDSAMLRLCDGINPDDAYALLCEADRVADTVTDLVEEMRTVNGRLRELLEVALSGWREALAAKDGES